MASYVMINKTKVLIEYEPLRHCELCMSFDHDGVCEDLIDLFFIEDVSVNEVMVQETPCKNLQ